MKAKDWEEPAWSDGAKRSPTKPPPRGRKSATRRRHGSVGYRRALLRAVGDLCVRHGQAGARGLTRPRVGSGHSRTPAFRLYEEGPACQVTVGSWAEPPLACRRCGAALMSLWPPRREDQAKLDASLAGASPKGRSGRQTKSGASGSELLTSRKHVPDRVGEPASDVDLGDLGPALLSQPALVALVAL